MTIKCTYEKCFRHFNSKQSMIEHKTKDPAHSYCKRCDVDCEDDMHLFIHQLGSSDHICCPVCAHEFGSTTGRDRHVETTHRGSMQVLSCAGCQQSFNTAASLMHHIERDECSVIRLTDFQMQRAEKQIQKDAWASETEPFTVSNRANTIPDTIGSHEMLDYHSLQHYLDNPLGDRSPNIAYASFPPLPTTNPDDKSIPNSKSEVTTSNLLDMNEPERELERPKISENAWEIPLQHEEPQTASTTGRVHGWLASVNNSSSPPSDQHSQVASMYKTKAAPTTNSSEMIPPSHRAANPDPAAPHQHIINMPAHSLISTKMDVQRFWDAVHQCYICPGETCQRRFTRSIEFERHLVSSAHVGGKVVCPSCLKRFATTTAWVAHCESASKRCDIRNSSDFNNVMREITGGVLGTQGFNDDGTVKYVAPEIQEW